MRGYFSGSAALLYDLGDRERNLIEHSKARHMKLCNKTVSLFPVTITRANYDCPAFYKSIMH